MRKLIKLKYNNDVIYQSDIIDFLDIENIYLPVKKNYNILVKNKENVMKNQIIMENNLQKVLSSISGQIDGVEQKNIDGINYKCLKIINNYKEESKNNIKKATKYSSEVIISKLYEHYYNELAKMLETKKIDNLIISGIDDEPYILNNNYIIHDNAKEILKLTDLLINNFKIKNCIIALKSNDSKNIDTLLNKIGTYPEIKISPVEDKYLIGQPFFLMEYLKCEDKNTLFIDSETAFDIYQAIFLDKNKHNKIITISGPCIEKSKVLNVKIGSQASEIINKKIKIKKEYINNYKCIVNGLMSGKNIDINNVVISDKTLGIIIIPNEDYEHNPCTNCGLCYKICPLKVNPKKVMDTKIKSEICIDCGLCSYICPSHINLRKFLRGENE